MIVSEHLAGHDVYKLLLWKKEPILVRQPVTGIDGQFAEEPSTGSLDLDVVLDGDIVPTEAYGPSEERFREHLLDPVSNGIHVLGCATNTWHIGPQP